MTPEITTLPNGLKVVSDPVPHLETATVGMWVDVGSRHEPQALSGISHLLEHMAFKGTETRSARAIAEEIEAVGGYLNAYTSREQTAYYARILKGDLPLAITLLSDILQRSVFDPVELAREQDVIVQEIGQAEDTPDDIIFDHLQEAAYPGQPIGRSILGTEETVRGVTQDALRSWMRDMYRAGGMTLIASGAVDHRALVALAGEAFGGLPQGGAPAHDPMRFAPGEMRRDDDLEQVHIAFGLDGVPVTADDAFAAQVFAMVLGGGMSSRLFQEVREARGLCYAISASSAHYVDGGLVTIYAGTGAKQASDLAAVVADETAALAQNATEEETRRARAQLKAGLLMSLEQPSARAELIAGHLLGFGRVLSVDEQIARLESVDAAAVRTFAARLTGAPARGLALAAIGPVGRLDSHDRIAARFGLAA